MPLEAIGSKVIVDPLYDAEKVYGLYIPDSGKNPMSQQGDVLAVGPEQKDIHVGDRILYHPFIGTPIRHEERDYLVIQHRHIVGWLSPDGEIFPLPDDVLILPEFPRQTEKVTKAGLIIPDTWFDYGTLPTFGRVVRRGERAHSVPLNAKVTYPQEAGNEIGLDNGTIRQVYYTVRVSELLAIVED